MTRTAQASLANRKPVRLQQEPDDGTVGGALVKQGHRRRLANQLLAAAFGVVLAMSAIAGAAFAAASAFTDVGDDHEHAAEIAAAHQIGVFNGYGDGTFRPDGKLTQRQAENVIWRILSWHGTDDDGNFEITRADAAALAMTGLCGLDGDRIPGCADISPQAAEEPRASGASDPDTADPDPTPSTPSYDGPVAECPYDYHRRPGRGVYSYVWVYGGYEDETGDPWCVQRSTSIRRYSVNGISSRMWDIGWCKTDSTDLLETATRTKTVEQGYQIYPEKQDQYVMTVGRFIHSTSSSSTRRGGWPIAGESVEIAAAYINPSALTYRGPDVQELHAALTDAHTSDTLAAGPPSRALRWLGTPEDVAAACFDALRQ